MNSKIKINLPKRSKSMCSLESEAAAEDRICRKGKYNNSTYRGYRSRTMSNSSIEVYVVNDSDSEETMKTTELDSGLGDKTFDEVMLQNLEQKIDKLSDMFLEQCRLLTTLKEEIRNSKTVIEKVDYAQIGTLNDKVKISISQNEIETEISTASSKVSSGKTLLDAIESTATPDYDQLIREVISGFLQSDEVKDNMVQATAESVKGVIGSVISRDISAIYLPVLEHSHKRLLRSLTKTVEDAFIELEENSVSLSKSVYKISSSLRRVIERHQCLLDAIADPNKNSFSSLKYTIEELLQKELSEWRRKVIEMFAKQLQIESGNMPEPPPLEYIMQPKTPQPVESGRSIVDQLMIAAEIKNQIDTGDVNGGFERALCAGDLDLVMTACRAGARVEIFTPYCRLRQNVLLALLQQLSTDMVNDTQLKCRYIEDAILNLDLKDANTRSHLPLVIGEIRKHLINFLLTNPTHACSKRVALIKLAADNLLN